MSECVIRVYNHALHYVYEYDQKQLSGAWGVGVYRVA